MTNIAMLPQKSDIWWIFLLQGFAGIIFGLMLVTEPGATIVALTTLLGFYWLITGLLGLVQVFVDRSTSRRPGRLNSNAQIRAVHDIATACPRSKYQPSSARTFTRIAPASRVMV